ncbi:MAG: hypothetical protein QM760_03230 [Nibricoccus sp.]
MKTPLIVPALTAMLLLGACVMKSPSPRAAINPAPPAQTQEADILQRKYDEQLKQRASEIYRNNGASSYAEAEQKAATELGLRPSTPAKP